MTPPVFFSTESVSLVWGNYEGGVFRLEQSAGQLCQQNPVLLFVSCLLLWSSSVFGKGPWKSDSCGSVCDITGGSTRGGRIERRTSFL